jgi:hypothetical protein
MSKYLEIKDDLRYLNYDAIISLLGELMTTAQDVAYAYDITEEMSDRLAEVMNDYEIRYEIIEEDI